MRSYDIHWLEAVAFSWLRLYQSTPQTARTLTNDLRDGELKLEDQIVEERAGRNPRARWLGFGYQYLALVQHALEVLRGELKAAVQSKGILFQEREVPEDLSRAWNALAAQAKHVDRRWMQAFEFERELQKALRLTKKPPVDFQQNMFDLSERLKEDIADYSSLPPVQTNAKWLEHIRLLNVAHQTVVVEPLRALATAIRAHYPQVVGAFFGVEETFELESTEVGLSKLFEQEVASALRRMGVDVRVFGLKRIAQGARVELEHTRNVEMAVLIALDHLRERADYYERLKD